MDISTPLASPKNIQNPTTDAAETSGIGVTYYSLSLNWPFATNGGRRVQARHTLEYNR